VSGASAPGQAALSGLEFLRAVAAGEDRSHGPTFADMLGMRLTMVERGKVEFTLTTRPEFANPLGTVHGGIAAIMLDSSLGCAVHSMLAAGDWYTTLELKVNYVRPPSLDGRTLCASGQVVHVGRTTGTAEGRVHDGDGRLIAHGTTTCLIRRA